MRTDETISRFPPKIGETKIEYVRRLEKKTGINRNTVYSWMSRHPDWMEKLKSGTIYTPEVTLQPGPKTEDVTTEKINERESNDSKVWEYSGTEVVDTIQKAIDKSGVNLNEWSVKDKEFKTWTTTMKLKETIIGDDGQKRTETRPIQKTNYYCRIKFERTDIDWSHVEELFRRELDKPVEIKHAKGSGIGIVATSDYHIGAKVKGLSRTPEFDLDLIREKFHQVAEKINSKKYEQVHLMICGDLVESVTGLNHLNTFKSLAHGAHGAHVMILAFKMIRDDFILKVKNVESVSVVSGNHDRITMSNQVDNEGSFSSIFAFMLNLAFPELDIKQDPLIVVREIDNIVYLILHGHHGMSKQEISKLIFDYGDNTKFNLVIEGHLHSRRAVKGNKIVYENSEIVSMDQLKYRKIVVAPLFTGNFYSESMGFGSTSGFSLIENNGSDFVNIFDFTI